MGQALVTQTELVALYIGLFFMMIGVALEVTRADWRQCLEHPGIFWAALALQLIGVPAMGVVLATLLPIDDELATGLLLIALCPGGVMSNFFAARAKGNVALSSALTLSSSLLVPITFPLGLFVLGQWHEGLAPAVAPDRLTQVAYLTAVLTFPPFLLGTVCKHYLPALAQRLSQPLKTFSFALVGAVIVGALYTNRQLLVTEIWNIMPTAFVFNALLLWLGYQAGRLMRWPVNIRRTLAIELGIQNATVGLILIPLLFPAQPDTFNMVAFWGVWHLVSGLFMALFWGHAPTERSPQQP